jgi:hypothetical protein
VPDSAKKSSHLRTAEGRVIRRESMGDTKVPSLIMGGADHWDHECPLIVMLA